MNKILLPLFMGLCLFLANAHADKKGIRELILEKAGQEFNEQKDHNQTSDQLVELTLDNREVTLNEKFCIPVEAKAFQGVLGMQFSIKYDPEKLDFVGVDNFGLEGLSLNSFGLPSLSSEMEAGNITFVWVAPTLSSASLEMGDQLFDLCFVSKAEGISTVSFTDQPTDIEVTNDLLEIVPFEGEDAEVLSTKASTASIQLEDVGMSILDKKVENNESFCVDITADEFINIVSMQYSLSYDPEFLEFEGVSDFNLPGLSEQAFGLPGTANELQDGTVTFSWVAPNLAPVTIVNDSPIYQLCFRSKQEGITKIDFKANPTAVEFINGQERELTHNLVGGSMQIGNLNADGTQRLNGLTLTATGGTVNPGEEICVPISVTNFNDIIGMQLSINYDPAALEFKELKGFNLSGLSAGVFGTPSGGTNPGDITLVWVEPSLSAVTVPDETIIFEVCFTALAESTGNVSFSGSPTSIEITNGNEENVDFNGVNAEVVVGSGGGNNGGGNNGGGAEGFTLTLADQTVNDGNTFCIPVTVENFDNIIGMQFSINYDPDALTFESLGNFNLSGLSEGVFGTPNGGTNPGDITLVWVEPALSPITLPDGTAIFEICFSSKTAGTSTQVSFSAMPTNIEITDGNEENVPFNGVDATVTLGGDIMVEGFRLTVGNATVKSGDQFCVPVTVNDFDNIIGMQLSINYDENELQFDAVNNFNLSGLSEGTFGLPPSGTSPGDITLVWVEPALSPVTLPDQTAIFDLCFTALGSDGSSSDIIFSSTPTSIEITDGNEQSVDFNSTKGTITIDDSVIGEGALTLDLSDEEVSAGSTFCTDVTTTDFNSLLGIQLSIDFDPSVLEFTEVNNFNLSGLTANQFATPSNDKITLAWVDNALNGVTVPDGTTIFSVCFNVLGSSGTTTVAFSETPTAIEVTKKEGDTERMVDFVGNEATITINNIPAHTIASPANITDNLCAGEANGAINIEVQGGSGNFTYQWSNGANTQDIANLAAGTYMVTVTDTETSLAVNGSFDVNEPASVISIGNIQVTDITCNGEQDGQITVTATGGTGNLTYNWNLGLPQGPNQTNLIASNAYVVSITDENGCTLISDPITVAEPPALRSEFSITDVECSGASDGSITLNVTGGTPEYSFDWSEGLQDNRSEQTGLSEGTYGVTITDASGCEIVLDDITINANNPITILDAATTDIGEDEGGSINLTINGGSGNYSYSWEGPGGVNATTEDINGLTVAGDYCITITDDNGCVLEDCVTLYEAMQFDGINITNTCAGISSGAISINVTGGLPPYTYNWADGSTTSDLSNLANGSYALTVTDDRGIDLRGTFEVGQFDAINVAETLIQVTGSPESPTGRINLDITGGESPYTVSWDNGSTSQVLNNVPVGTYCVTITDDNGCEFNACYDLEFQPLPLEVSPRFENVSCQGENDGSLILIIQGGVIPYEISFTTGETEMNTNGLVNKSNLAGGEIGYTVRDASGASIEGTVMIMEFDPVVIENVEVVHDTDEEGCNGSISLSLAGGAPGITVEWNSPNTGRTIINLCEGEFIPTIIDGNGCTITGDPIQVNTFGIEASVAAASCQDSQDGSITLQVSGGEDPYTYEWRNSRGALVSTNASPSNLAADTYTLRITENTGNIINREFVLPSDSDISVSAEVLTDFNGFSVSCGNASDGRIRALPQGGDGSYSYEWILGNTMVGMGSTLENASPGIYELVVIDGNGCAVSTEVEMTSPAPILLNASIRDISCNGGRDGEIVVLATAGGDPSGINFSWADGSTNSRRSFLSQGNYEVSVSDDNGCTEVEAFTVNEPEPITVEVTSNAATVDCNGSVRAIVSGGTEPYNFNWNVPGNPNESSVGNLCPGDYMVEVTDINGCVAEGAPFTANVKDRRFPCFESRVVITPDGDGLNEEFLINCIDDFSTNTLTIYNRWGQLVFEMENYDNSFNGRTMNGEELPEGPYYYVLDYTNVDNTPLQVKGSISLLRE